MKKQEVSVPEKHLISIHGNDIPRFLGMVDIAHQLGLQSIDTIPLQLPSSDNGNTAIFKSTVTLKSGIVCSAIGDATPENVPPACRNAFIRMASTRATSRAIGLACNVGTLDFESETMTEQVIDVDYRDSSASSTVQTAHSKPVSQKQLEYIHSLSDNAEQIAMEKFSKDLNSLTTTEAHEVICECRAREK